MANFASIARPYAYAAFEVARESNQLEQWKSFLAFAAQIAEDSSLIQLLMNPDVSAKKSYELFASLLESHLDDTRRNFLHLLAQNQRLLALPEIAGLFKAYAAELEKVSHVRLVTAIAVDDSYKQTIADALHKRIKRDVTLRCEVDPHIIGGAVIHIGDSVIDGSIRGKLTRLLEFSLR